MLQAPAMLASLHLPAPPPCPRQPIWTNRPAAFPAREEVAAGGPGHRAREPLREGISPICICEGLCMCTQAG